MEQSITSVEQLQNILDNTEYQDINLGKLLIMISKLEQPILRRNCINLLLQRISDFRIWYQHIVDTENELGNLLQAAQSGTEDSNSRLTDLARSVLSIFRSLAYINVCSEYNPTDLLNGYLQELINEYIELSAHIEDALKENGINPDSFNHRASRSLAE